ncbi:hydrogenase maturation nickel metallochaperone HypA [Candidatus Uabimicrobium amorphum]|uniref:Putative hydrogenase nickel incorporationprotein HypA 2 n=1 Tax=Uabimicrobium amorphum TaxID=2596890 RepID=A0A5S9IVX5_UABAM|nr:hydrogenase maturation nickel metallochaperone HypA [Candidatus Uabimicrobium amorphum]BBM88252.1 putative hydrogenase nickel incorporationprotein HypA 2 [Candidatus Uabimicrobium amorphum]
MHEYSLLADLMRKIQNIAQEQQADKVTLVKVKLGALAHISADHFREHFEHSSNNTVAEGAELEIEVLTDTNDPNAQQIILDSIEVMESE